MNNLSRQFRDKEYWTFDLTVTDPAYIFIFNFSQIYGLIRMEVNGQIYDETNGWPAAGLTLPIGTHEVKMWTRELSNLQYFYFISGTLGDLDFSKCKEMYYLRTHYGSIGTLTLPTTTQRLSGVTTGMTVYSYYTTGWPISLDLSPWINIGVKEISIWTSGIERYILPTNNPAGLQQLLIQQNGTPIRAIGSGAATSNTVDLSNQTLKASCYLNLQSIVTGPLPTPGNYNDIIWPTVWGTGNLQRCTLTGSFCTTIDLSSVPFQIWSGTYPRIDLTGHSALTNFIKPSVTEGAKIYGFIVNNCDVLTSIDIDTLTNLHGWIYIRKNALVTSITLPSTTTPCDTIYIDENAVLGYIDFTSMSNLTDINNCTVFIKNNNWSTAIVNQVLEDLDTISSGGYTGRTITIDGSNAAPTVGPPDGLAAILNLIAKGFTVTTS